MKIINKLTENFSSTWLLLSETTVFLSRTKIFQQHEQDLKNWRDQLRKYGKNPEAQKEIRKNIVQLRKNLRDQGYNLKFGIKDLKIDGFRHDDCIRDGFKRLVISITDQGVFYISGMDNHIQLAEVLELRRPKVHFKFLHNHYLWYKWSFNILILSGADSETADNFELLLKFYDQEKDFLLNQLKRLV